MFELEMQRPVKIRQISRDRVNRRGRKNRLQLVTSQVNLQKGWNGVISFWAQVSWQYPEQRDQKRCSESSLTLVSPSTRNCKTTSFEGKLASIIAWETKRMLTSHALLPCREPILFQSDLIRFGLSPKVRIACFALCPKSGLMHSLTVTTY